MGSFFSHLCAFPVLIGSLMFAGIPRRVSLLQHISEVWHLGVGCDYRTPQMEGQSVAKLQSLWKIHKLKIITTLRVIENIPLLVFLERRQRDDNSHKQHSHKH